MILYTFYLMYIIKGFLKPWQKEDKYLQLVMDNYIPREYQVILDFSKLLWKITNFIESLTGTQENLPLKLHL